MLYINSVYKFKNFLKKLITSRLFEMVGWNKIDKKYSLFRKKRYDTSTAAPNVLDACPRPFLHEEFFLPKKYKINKK
jgi:hypothetical protein